MQGAGPLRSPRKTGLLRVCEQVRPAQHRGQAGSSGCFTHSCRAGGHQGTAEPTHHRVPEPGQSFLSVVKIHLPRARASPPVGSCPSAQHGGLQPAPPRCKGTWRLRCWRPKVAGTEPGLPLPPLARRPPGSQASLGLFSAILQSTKGQGPGSASRAPWGHPLSCSRQVREPRHRAELPQMPATPWMWRMQWGRYLDPQRPRSAGAEWALPRARPAPRIWHGQKAPWPWSREGDGTRSAICALRTGRAQIPFTEENWCSSGRLLLLPRRPRVAGSRDSPCGGTAEPGPRAVRHCPWPPSNQPLPSLGPSAGLVTEPRRAVLGTRPQEGKGHPSLASAAKPEPEPLLDPLLEPHLGPRAEGHLSLVTSHLSEGVSPSWRGTDATTPAMLG
ncbi:uncharacterized protein LOC101722544 isoform X2 [Heterocephalus glaber]|uniref:Uncharacterized protein LOC101722544 isoform X2 n=1 Tax=Heterocephalus glaber TaxID=10181 RepID=A0AAX6T508_HETGA|nr:uncharacterized protein LOC101722544 isoform X2 [Heterocephalus glaber]